MEETSPACLIGRICARCTDYLIWGIATALALSFDVGRFYSPASLYYLSFCLYPFAEAFALYRFGTTPGKKIHGVSVVSVNERLSFKAALIRSLTVFVCGFGMFLPYVSLIAPVVCLIVYGKRQTMIWDVRSGTATVGRPVPRKVKAAALCFYLFVLFGYASTARMILSQNLDPAAPERALRRFYGTVFRPALLETLTVEASVSRTAAEDALKRLDVLKAMLRSERDKYIRATDEISAGIAALPDGRFRDMQMLRLKERRERDRAFLFREAVRIDLMRKALDGLLSAEFEIRDGEPVFADEESERLYKAYLDALETFFAVHEQENVRRP